MANRLPERRFLPWPVSLETRVGTDYPYAVGYAAVFYNPTDSGTEFMLYDDLAERLSPGCFDRAMKEDDCRALFNHDANYLLGRVGAGTLSLSCDTKGLRYEVQLPDTQVGRDCATSLKRGDLAGSSFSFIPTRVEYQREKGKPTIRWIREVQLYDVGPVTFPAYASTSAGVRSADARQDFERWREAEVREEARKCGRIMEAAVRARCAELGL